MEYFFRVCPMALQMNTLANKCTSTFRIQKEESLQFIYTATRKHYRLGVLNNKHLFLTVLEAGTFKIKVPAGFMSGKDSFWFR